MEHFPTFPTRVPKTVKFTIDDQNPDDPLCTVILLAGCAATISNLKLPRYGLGNYIVDKESSEPTDTSGATDSWKTFLVAGKRLIGFSRTNLFKRLGK